MEQAIQGRTIVFAGVRAARRAYGASAILSRMMGGDVKEQSSKSYYKNGRLRSEVELLNGVPHGITRVWHENGQLSREMPLREGKLEGVIRQWDRMGKLLGACEIKEGSGFYCEWHENGQLKLEIPYFDGDYHGRARSWTEAGEAEPVSFFIAGRSVPESFFERYAGVHPSKWNAEMLLESLGFTLPDWFEWLPKGQDDSSKQRMCEELCAKHGLQGVEARSWLQGGRAESRSLGEDLTTAQSLVIVDYLYALGSPCVVAVNIDRYEAQLENTGQLVVMLPTDASRRAVLFQMERSFVERRGFEGTRDSGQDFVRLDLG